MLSRVTETVLRHRRIVVVVWLLLLVGGFAAAGKASQRLAVDFSLPGQPGYETGQRIVERFGNGGNFDPYLLTVRAPDGQRVDAAAATAAFARVQQSLPQARIVDRASSGSDFFVTDDGRTAFAYAFLPFPRSFAEDPAVPLRAALADAAPSGSTPAVTGLQALATTEGAGSGPGVLVETLLGGLGALAVLAFVFASLLAFVPLVIAAFSILTTFLVVLGLTYLTEISFVVQFLVALIGLGVAIDYSLLIVNRWREERDHGRDNVDAVRAAMATAGSAVVFSGVTVAIGLLALAVVPVPLLRSMALGGVLIPLVSVLVSLTLLPVMLASIGPRVDWPRIRHEDRASRGWSAWARLVVRRRWVATGVAAAVLAVVAAPFFGIKIGTSSSESLARSGPAYEALQALERGGRPAGVLTPMEILTTPDAAAGVAARVREVDGVVAAFPAGGRSVQGDRSVVLAVPVKESDNSTDIAAVRRVQDAVAADPAVVGVAGIGPAQIDYVNAVYKNFPAVLAVIVVLTFVLLARAFRSVLLPIKAIVLNLLSLAATFGALVFFWQQGHGSRSVFDIAPTGAITFWLPVLLFAFLYGLSMDYEVFILARMREAYDGAASTNRAVVEGIGRTGRLVTSAALILFLAFLSLASGPQTDVKVLATGLGFGILLDATVVRALLVPALVSLFGRWNWYLPDGFARLLRVEPSHAHAEVDDPQPDRLEPAPAG